MKTKRNILVQIQTERHEIERVELNQHMKQQRQEK